MKTIKLLIFVLIFPIFIFLSGFNSCNNPSSELERKVKEQEKYISELKSYISSDEGIAYINKSKYPLKLSIVYLWKNKKNNRKNEEIILFDSLNKEYKYKSFLMECNDRQKPDSIAFYVESAYARPNIPIPIGTTTPIEVIDNSLGSVKSALVKFKIDYGPNPDFCDKNLLAASKEKLGPRAVYTVIME